MILSPSGGTSSSSTSSAPRRRRLRSPRRPSSPCPHPTCSGTSAISSAPRRVPMWCSRSAARRLRPTGACSRPGRRSSTRSSLAR
uniref:Uncharacterized protein n=1 Tax=Arundo donax TaxID=35708 RepID=A0A0A9DDM2_ARUDO